jgi:FAD/FMN-containing dehydrogenase
MSFRLSRRALLGSLLASPLLAAAPSSPSSLHIVRKGDADYASARINKNRAVTSLPQAVAYAFDERDVIAALRYAKDAGLPISVRSGGHDYEGFSTNDNGLVIDLSRFDGIAIDREDGSCRVAPGVLLRTLYHRLFTEASASLPAGSCGTVGVSGLTLGGGFGPLGRMHGLLCDRLRAVRLVDAAGELRTSAADPDLLWACRGGGGGNFGIVTEFVFDLVAVPAIVTTFSLNPGWNAGVARTTALAFTQSAPNLPREISPTLLLSRNENAVELFGLSLLGEPQTQSALREIVLAIGGTLTTNRVPYLAAVERGAGNDTDVACWKMTSSFLGGPLSGDGCDAVTRALIAPHSGQVQFELFGGSIARLRQDASAFWHRDKSVLIQCQSYWRDPEKGQPERAWVASAFASIDPHTTRSSYRNYCDLALTDWPVRYYGANYARLQQIKARLDAQNRFSYPQSIRLP